MRPQHPIPRAGDPLRLAFVGQQTFFEACALDERSRRVITTFVEFRQGADADAMRGALDAFAPHAVVVFRPEIVPAGTFDGLRATTLGFLTEPIPRTTGRRAHPDLRRRRADLEAADPGNFDRIVAFDPLIVDTADPVLPVWRALPIPVADRLYSPVRRSNGTPRLGFVGRSTPHREAFLAGPKHELDLLHVAFGLHGSELDAFMARLDVAVNLHNEPYPSFENRVCLHLAAGPSRRQRDAVAHARSRARHRLRRDRRARRAAQRAADGHPAVRRLPAHPCAWSPQGRAVPREPGVAAACGGLLRRRRRGRH